MCLEGAGCPLCTRPGGHGATCAAYAARAACPCGGPDKARLRQDGGALACACCGARYPIEAGGWVDLVPRASVGEVTQYADHEFHERLHVTEAEPVLSARVKADMMRRMLGAAPGETVLDLGCGAGKMALYAAQGGRRAAGLDVAPFFLPRAAREVDLVLGDLRRLPFRKGSFPRAYSLDVLEHLDEPGVREVLLEARRTLGPRGRLFVYTHAMESSRMASFQRGVNRLARRLGRAGLIDHEREAMRKSDHRNAIRSHEHFDELCAGAGLRVAERRYYNVVFKAVVEDLGLRLFEQWRRRRTAAARGGPGHVHEHVHVHEHDHGHGRRDATRAFARPHGGRARPDLAPQARRGPLRRRAHGAVLRPPRAARARVRILYVATDQTVPGATGGSVHVLEVAQGLARRGHEVHAVVAASGGPAREEGEGVVWHRVGWRPRHRFFRFRARPAVESIADEVRPAVVMERYYNFGGEGIRAAAARGIPSLLEVNSPVVDHPRSAKAALDAALLVRPLRRYRESLCRQAAALVSPIPEIVPEFARAKTETVTWGANVDSFSPARRRRGGAAHARHPGGIGGRPLHRELPALARRPRPGDRRAAAAGPRRSLLPARRRRGGRAPAKAIAAGGSGPVPTPRCPTSWPPPTSASLPTIRRGCASSPSASTGRR